MAKNNSSQPNPEEIAPPTGIDGEMNDEELDEVSGGLLRLGNLNPVFSPNPPPISPIFNPSPPPITQNSAPGPPPIRQGSE